MSDDTPPTKRLKSNFEETFGVLVGTEPQQKRFTVHHDIFTKRSRFFRAATSGSWTTDRSKPVDLTEHDPDTFVLYSHCVYRDVVPRITLQSDNEVPAKKVTPAKREADIGKRSEALVKLYILADKLIDPVTANMVIDEIRGFGKSYGGLPSAKAISLAYKSTTAFDALRTLLIDYYVEDAYHLPAGDYPAEFLRSVLRLYMRWKGIDRDNDRSNGLNQCSVKYSTPCVYHRHDNDHPESECSARYDSYDSE